VNQAITQMDQVTQQNAALVEEASAAAESMKQQAQQLVQAVACSSWPRMGGAGRAVPEAKPRSSSCGRLRRTYRAQVAGDRCRG